MEDQSDNVLPQIPATEAVAEASLEGFPVPGGRGEIAMVMEEKPLEVGDNGGDHRGMLTASVGLGGIGESELVGKKKRERWRKQTVLEAEQGLMAMESHSAPPQKRGRGRPKSSGKWQILAPSFGGSQKPAAGIKFSPAILSVQTGENIVQKLLLFSQYTSDSLCIFSASGTVSSVDMFQPCLHGGIVRYEGRFDIVSLKGSHTYGDNGGQLRKKKLLSVQFVDVEGAFFGGAVAGSLIAAGPTQVVVAMRTRGREQVKVRHRVEAPKPNKRPATLHMQLENGNLTDANVQRLRSFLLWIELTRMPLYIRLHGTIRNLQSLVRSL